MTNGLIKNMMRLTVLLNYSIITKVADTGEIRGFYLCRQGLKLTNLFFLQMTTSYFVDPPWQNVRRFLLVWYEDVSRQQVNKDKTTLFFSHNTLEDTQEATKNSLGVPTIKNYEKYLGLP